MEKQPEAEIRRFLAEQIIARRRERSWTQQQLAAASGVPRTYIADLEDARRNPSIATLLRIANGLRVLLADLLRPAG